MARIRQRLLDEKAGIKKSEEKRKEREMKKIGKQLQIEKLKERRERGLQEVEKVKGMKRSKRVPAFRTGVFLSLTVYCLISYRTTKFGRVRRCF
jgi:Eukaryotic rRNA processing protein EBP2